MREIRITDPFDLGGSSFGGMIALELARHLSPQHVFLFGSCRSPDASRHHFALSARSLRWRLTDCFTRRGCCNRSSLDGSERRRRHTLTSSHGCSRQLRQRSFDGRRALFSPGAALPSYPCRSTTCTVIVIALIPVRRVKPDRVIAGAGPLLNVTHADA